MLLLIFSLASRETGENPYPVNFNLIFLMFYFPQMVIVLGTTSFRKVFVICIC